MIKIGPFHTTPKRKAQEILKFEIKRVIDTAVAHLPDNPSVTGEGDRNKVIAQFRSYEKRIMKILNPPKKED